MKECSLLRLYVFINIFTLYLIEGYSLSHSSKMYKTKKINKIPIQQQKMKQKSFSQLRDHLKRQMVSPKFQDGWARVLQIHKKDTLSQSASFKQAVKENQDFTCSICYNLMIFPVILPCGHAFCRPCIEQATLLQDRCCICRTPNKLQYFTVCKKINDIIMTLGVQQLKEEEKKLFQKRYLDYIAWQQITMIDPEFRIGEKVHFYDYNLMGWRYGVITKVTIKGGVDLFLFVEPLFYLSQHEIHKKGYYFHYLSSRIATYEFFFQDIDQWILWSREPQNRFKERESYLKQVIKRRIQDKSIRTKKPVNTLALSYLFSPIKNILKHLQVEDRFKEYDKIFNYSFREFEQGVKIKRQALNIVSYSMRDQSDEGQDDHYTSSFEN